MLPISIDREIARIRAIPGQNFHAIALQTIQDALNQIIIPSAASQQTTKTNGTSAIATGGGSSPAPTPTPAAGFNLFVNGISVPNAANLSNTWPPSPLGRLPVWFQVDTSMSPPSISASFASIPNSLLNVNFVAFSATPVFDASLGQIQEITLTGNVTSFTIINGVPGQFLCIIWIQDSSGGHTVSGVPATVKNFVAPTATMNSYSAQVFAYDGTDWVSATPQAASTAPTDVALAPSVGGNFTVAHGLSFTPSEVLIRMTSLAIISFQTPTGWDATNLYLVASDGPITGVAVCYP